MIINTAPTNAVVCWGDSLTSKTDVSNEHSATQGSYPMQWLNAEPVRPIYYPMSYPGKNADYVTDQAKLYPMLANWTSIYWAGTNNQGAADVANGFDKPPAVVVAAAKRFVSNLTHSRFLIVSPFCDSALQTGNPYNALRQSISNALLTAFPNNYVDVWSALLAAGPAGNATDGGSSVGVVHTSLRTDTIHLNNAGNNVAMLTIKSAVAAKGW